MISPALYVFVFSNAIVQLLDILPFVDFPQEVINAVVAIINEANKTIFFII